VDHLERLENRERERDREREGEREGETFTTKRAGLIGPAMANFRFKEGEGGRLKQGEGGRLDTKERHSPNKEKVKGINTSEGGGEGGNIL
jgi:hypothetical protein